MNAPTDEIITNKDRINEALSINVFIILYVFASAPLKRFFNFIESLKSVKR